MISAYNSLSITNNNQGYDSQYNKKRLEHHKLDSKNETEISMNCLADFLHVKEQSEEEYIYIYTIYICLIYG